MASASALAAVNNFILTGALRTTRRRPGTAPRASLVTGACARLPRSHDADEGFSGQDYWPEEMQAQDFYEPTDRGFEARVRERIEFWNQRRRELQQSSPEAG